MSLVTDAYRADVRHDGRSYLVEIPKLRYFRCKHCGSIVIPDEADEVIGIELRRVANLLPPHRIKEIRDKFGLTQKELAERMGIGEATVCRWEKGTQIQQRAFDKLLRAYEDVPGLHEYLGGEKPQAALVSSPTPVAPLNVTVNMLVIYPSPSTVAPFTAAWLSGSSGTPLLMSGSGR